MLLNWFKQQREFKALKAEEQKLKNKLLEKELKSDSKDVSAAAFAPEKGLTTSDKLFKKVKLVNNVLTVVLINGDVISKSDATVQDFEDVRGVQSEEDLFFIMSTNRDAEERAAFEKEIEKNQKVIKGFPVLEQTGDFVINNEEVHLKELYDKGVRRSIPKLLVEKFSEIAEGYDPEASAFWDIHNDVEYNSLKKFWMKCCLNPNAQSAEDLYEFLEKHNMKIDKHGNFYAYRRVVSIKSSPKDKELVEFVSNAYNKVKAVWKKKCSVYTVWQDDSGEYSISKTDKADGINKIIGNLEELYLNLPNMSENRYTDAHTHKMDYRVGEIASIPRDKGDDDNSRSCSKGLHIASKEYNYSGFGDTPILAIVNPMDVLAAPLQDRAKLRTARWFFAMTLPEDEKYILEDDDFDVTELGDIFEEKCSTDLVNYVHNSIAEEVKRHTFTVPKLSSSDITNIVNSLDKVKEELTKRVSIIK